MGMPYIDALTENQIKEIQEKVLDFQAAFEVKNKEQIKNEYEAILNKAAYYENQLLQLEENLKRKKDKTWIFLDAKTVKNTYIEQKLSAIQTLKGTLTSIKTSLDTQVGKPQRIALAKTDIQKRNERRMAMAKSLTAEEFNLRKRAQDNFTRSFKVDPIDNEEAAELMRITAELDKIKLQGVDATFFEKSAAELRELSKDIVGGVKVVGTETFFTAGKSVALLFAWPILLTMDAINFVSDIVSRGFRASEAFLQTYNDYAQNEASKSTGLKNVGWNLLRFSSGILALTCAAVKGVTRLVANMFDTDALLKRGSQAAAFGMGWIGAALLITFAIASVFTFGIPIAMVVTGAAFAAVVGVAKIGVEYSKFSEKRKARREFRLTGAEEAQLVEWGVRNNTAKNKVLNDVVGIKDVPDEPDARPSMVQRKKRNKTDRSNTLLFDRKREFGKRKEIERDRSKTTSQLSTQHEREYKATLDRTMSQNVQESSDRKDALDRKRSSEQLTQYTQASTPSHTADNTTGSQQGPVVFLGNPHYPHAEREHGHEHEQQEGRPSHSSERSANAGSSAGRLDANESTLHPNESVGHANERLNSRERLDSSEGLVEHTQFARREEISEQELHGPAGAPMTLSRQNPEKLNQKGKKGVRILDPKAGKLVKPGDEESSDKPKPST